MTLCFRHVLDCWDVHRILLNFIFFFLCKICQLKYLEDLWTVSIVYHGLNGFHAGLSSAAVTSFPLLEDNFTASWLPQPCFWLFFL